jgi:hypothetical protein
MPLGISLRSHPEHGRLPHRIPFADIAQESSADLA